MKQFLIYRLGNKLLASSGDPGTGTGRLIHSLKDLLIPCAKCEVRETTPIAFNPMDEFVNFDDPHIKVAKPASGKIEAKESGVLGD